MNPEDLRKDTDDLAMEFITNAVYSRMQWLAGLADPKRDIFKECGYPTTLTADDYRDLYDRDPLSARVVQVMPRESWQVQPQVYEDEDPETDTAFEQDWRNLHQSLQSQSGSKSWYQDEEGSPIWEKLLRADILSGIGHYGVILLGIDDGRPLDQPLEGFEGIDGQPLGTEAMYGPYPNKGDAVGYDTYTTKQLIEQGVPSFATPVPFNVTKDGGTTEEQAAPDSGKRRLIFIKVFDETLAKITRYERDPHNARFGLPQMYLLTFNDPRNDPSSAAGLPVASAHCHWSRIIHIADNMGANDVLGYPRMKQVYNRLWDAFKVYGASGEGFWQQAFAMLSLETNPQLGADFTIDHAGIGEQLEKLRNKLQRHLVTAGMTAKTLPPALSDPTAYIAVFIEVVCIFLGCPVRVFKGSERGELASSQDDSSWNDRLRHRQLFYITPKILVPFIDRLIAAKVLSEPEEGYSILWPDLEALSDKDKAAIALQLTQAISAYIAGQCENLMSPMDFMVEVLKLPHAKAQQILDSAQQAAENEEQMTVLTPEEQQEQTDANVPTPSEPGPPQGVKLKDGEKLVHPETGEPLGNEFNVNYNPSQPRDASGRWGSGGGVAAGPTGGTHGQKVADRVERKLGVGKLNKVQRHKVALLNPESQRETGVVKLPLVLKQKHGTAVVEGKFPNDKIKWVNALKLEKKVKGQPANPPAAKAKPDPGNAVHPSQVAPIGGHSHDTLKKAEVTTVDVLGGGINGTYIAKFADGTKGVWKPKDGEHVGLRRNVPAGTYYHREAAASSVAHVIGMNDLVPITVTREVNGKKGSMQQWADNSKTAHAIGGDKMYNGHKDLARAAAFDYMINNTDRHSGNWMIQDGSKQGRIKLIDNGLAFPTNNSGFRSYLFDKATKLGLEVPKEVLTWDINKIEAAMRQHKLPDTAVNVVKERLKILQRFAKTGDTFDARDMGVR